MCLHLLSNLKMYIAVNSLMEPARAVVTFETHSAFLLYCKTKIRVLYTCLAVRDNHKINTSHSQIIPKTVFLHTRSVADIVKCRDLLYNYMQLVQKQYSFNTSILSYHFWSVDFRVCKVSEVYIQKYYFKVKEELSYF